MAVTRSFLASGVPLASSRCGEGGPFAACGNNERALETGSSALLTLKRSVNGGGDDGGASEAAIVSPSRVTRAVSFGRVH